MPRADRCIYCRQADLSDEDLLPLWLDKYYSLKKPTGLISRVGTIHGRPQPKRRYPKMRVKVRACCQRCNNGWMSRMEKRVQPVLRPLLFYGAPKDFLPDAQELVSAWFTKFVMTAEWSVFTRPAYFHQDERWQFRQTQKPLTGTTIWLAPSRLAVGNPGVYLWKSKGHDLLIPAHDAIGPTSVSLYLRSKPWPGVCYTMRLFRMTFQLVHMREGYLPPLSEVGWDPATFQIWPIDPTQKWPPAKVLREAHFGRFADRWKTSERVLKRPTKT